MTMAIRSATLLDGTPSPPQRYRAPGAGSAAPADEATPEKHILVGHSQIRGSKVTAALPIAVLDSKQIDAIGALTGDDQPA